MVESTEIIISQLFILYCINEFKYVLLRLRLIIITMKYLLKFLIAIVCIAFVFSFASCNDNEVKKVTNGKYTEKTEETTAEIEAAMMMGRNKARNFLNRNLTDSAEFDNHLRKVRSTRRSYIKRKWNKSADAFDSIFISTIKTVKPDLAIPVSQRYEELKREP